ncbi:cellulase family glycosylhydrolase [Mangrovimonas sp. YM274]|uniref:cellulase family glycosylhydrolase n=1 Tax=Mangrovimonas sp. YM274 TaxID=3070660 RepID=UPI0027DC9F49|nr:cellulase family glycosylhydrolase [Mangrovimonas sp. YM274]WMI68293.1 cellulase family glycosylhydrolase [Mangrovimonas sp. YM274]
MKAINSILKITALFVLMIGFASCNEDDDNYGNGTFSVDINDLNFSDCGGQATFNVTASPYITWGVSSEADWLTFSSTSGAGNGSIIITAPEMGTERTAVVTVYTAETTHEIQVFQEGAIEADPSEMSDYTSVQLTEIMGVGWNVGNSLESIGGETAWGNPEINQDLIDAVKAAGFNTVRIPVAWTNYIEEDNGCYTISEEGLTRVEEVVNYVLSNDMFAIVNNHWDGGWMQPTYDQQAFVNDKLSKIWRQIAMHFRDYDYHLIFAGSNEVMVEGDYGTPTEEYYTVQNSFNQTFISAVRATGGRNAYRYLTVQGFNTNIDHTVNFAVVPEDTVANRMLMEVHYYDPYQFTLEVSNDNAWQWGAIATDPSATSGWGDEDWLETQFAKMETNFVNQGIGVILGEYGASYRGEVEGAEVYRAYYYQKTTESALNHGMVPVIWDNGYPDNHQMGLFNRNTGEEYFPDIIDAAINN